MSLFYLVVNSNQHSPIKPYGFNNPIKYLRFEPAKKRTLFIGNKRTCYTKSVHLTFALFNGERADKEQLAQQLLKVLDARGLLVMYSEIPDTPNYIDSLSGLPQHILFNDLPEVYLSKVG